MDGMRSNQENPWNLWFLRNFCGLEVEIDEVIWSRNSVL